MPVCECVCARARRVRLRVSACVREVCETFWNEESAGLDESKVGSTESKEKEVVEEAALLPPRSWGRRERRFGGVRGSVG